MPDNHDKIRCLNKSFARRVGKSLSILQQTLLQNELPQYLLSPLALPERDKYVAEIGIGMGDHFVARAAQEVSALHIGFEPYLNGVANSLKLIKEYNVRNILLWPDDVDLVFDLLPHNLLSALYVLFPDPWPKTAHHKRRLINLSRMKLFASKIKPGGALYFVSDISDYFMYAKDVIENSGLFHDVIASQTPYDGYIKTKYHHKADREGRSSSFLVANL